MDVQTAIANRRSIRKFKQEPVPGRYIQELIEAARWAPSGTNHQPWRFIIVRDQQVKQQLEEAAFGQKYISEAPVVLVCCADLEVYRRDTKQRVLELIAAGAMEPAALETYPGLVKPMDEASLKTYIPHAMLNVAIAMENIALQAVALGLGTCIVQMIKTKKIANILLIPENFIITALLVVGIPDECPAARPRLNIQEIILKEI